MRLWRVLFLSLCLLMMLSLTAYAEKVDWKDNTYDFSRVQRALIYDVVFTDTSEISSDLTLQVLQDEYQKNAARPKYQVVREDLAARLSPEDPVAAADVYVKAELMKWHDDSYVKPGYTSWEQKEIKRTIRDSDGFARTESYYITVPVEHPPVRVYTSTVRVKFDVYDSKTGNRILARDESRVRDDSYQGQKGIFGRICKSFFDDFGKKIKKKTTS